MNLDPKDKVQLLPFPSHFEKIGLVLAILPFFVHYTSSTSQNGVVIGYYDYAAIVIGAMTSMMIIPMVLQLKKTDPANRMKHLGAIAAIDLLGILHILRGLGVF